MALTSNQRSLLFVIVALIMFVLGLQLMGFGLFAKMEAMERVLTSNYDKLLDLSRLASVPCTINTCIFFEISIAFDPPQRLVMQLYNHKAPNVAENFRALATGEKGVTTNGTRLHYKGTTFNRVIHGILIQGGDIYGGRDANEDIEAIDIPSLESETDDDLFDKAGLVSLVGSGPSKNGYEFFITVDTASDLNGMHVVFGEVIQGMDTVYKINNVTLKESEPQVPIVIMDCGQV